MLKINKAQRKLLVGVRCFGNNTLISEKDYNLRVMSTPTWPVPYYQRLFRDPPLVERLDIDLSIIRRPLCDMHVIFGKEMLKSHGYGYIVQIMEDHFPINDYKTSYTDSSKFSKIFVDDLLDCIDVAHKENAKLLNSCDLADCLEC